MRVQCIGFLSQNNYPSSHVHYEASKKLLQKSILWQYYQLWGEAVDGTAVIGGASLRHTLYICGISSLISILFSLSACDTYGWFSLFHFFFHSKCMLRPIAVLLRTRSDPCKAASDGWLNHDESLGSLIYMPLNSTFGSIRTKSNIYVVYWNC